MKTYLITGASGGIGQSIAKRLAKKDNLLILIYNNNNVDNLIEQIKDKTTVARYHCDLSNFNEVENMYNDLIKNYNKIDVLINCAGVSLTKQIQDTTPNDIDFIFNNNIKSVINLTTFVSKFMISNQYGRIINISSMWGKVGSSMESLYSASKGAINSLTLSLAKELGPSNITVNAICPGWIDTKMNKDYSEQDKLDFIESSPIKRIGIPEDVASLVEFLTSDNASFITGQLISVDGGATL